MGILDNLKNVLGGRKDVSTAEATKAPSQVLKENGIDPRGLKYSFGSDGTITVSGEVQQEADKARIREILGGLPGIRKVKQDLTVAKGSTRATEPAAATETADAKSATLPSQADAGEAADSENTYTVQPGDTLWKIAKQFYGDGTKYMKIFEANQGILKNPDHILPGQELVIPE